MTELLDDLFAPNFAQKTLGFSANTNLDLSRLVIGGHSFGGMTAISVANQDRRVRACFTLDPWLWPRATEIESGGQTLTVPQIHIVTDGFAQAIKKHFDNDMTVLLQTMLAGSSDDGRLLTLLKSNHFH